LAGTEKNALPVKNFQPAQRSFLKVVGEKYVSETQISGLIIRKNSREQL